MDGFMDVRMRVLRDKKIKKNISIKLEFIILTF